MFGFFKKRKFTSPEIERTEQHLAKAAELIHRVVYLWEHEKDAKVRELLLEPRMKHQFAMYYAMQSHLEVVRLRQEINESCAKLLG